MYVDCAFGCMWIAHVALALPHACRVGWRERNQVSSSVCAVSLPRILTVYVYIVLTVYIYIVFSASCTRCSNVHDFSTAHAQ